MSFLSEPPEDRNSNDLESASKTVHSSQQNDLNLLPGDINIFDRRAILNTISAFSGLTIVFGVLNSSGAIEPLIYDALGGNTAYSQKSVSSVDISWVFSINLLFLLGSGIFAGCKIDRSGTRSLTYFSCSLATLTMFCFSKSGHSLACFIVLYGLFGVAQGLLMTCCFSSLASWYKKNLSTFSGIISMGGSIGGIVFPIFIRKCYMKMGFEKTILIYAGIIGFLALVCALLCNDNFQEKKNKGLQSTETFGDICKVYFKDTINLKYFLSFKFFVASIGLSTAEIGTTIIATYLTSYCTKKGYSKQQAYTFITVLNAFGILGRSWGFIADKWLGKFQTIILCMFIATMANFVFLLAFGKHMWSMYLFCAFYGSTISGFLSLCPTAVSVLCDGNDFGKRFSTMYLFAACASIPFLEISGVIIGDQTSSIKYQYFWIFTSFILLLGCVCYIYLTIVGKGFKWAKY